jgi:hypothetical protein
MARDAVTQTAKSETAEESPIASDKYQPLASSSALEKSPNLEKSPAIEQSSTVKSADSVHNRPWLAQQDPEALKIKENITQSLQELTLVNGNKLARTADSYVYGVGVKSVLAQLPYDQFQAFQQKYEQKSGGQKLDLATLDKLKDFSPADESRMQRYLDGQKDPEAKIRQRFQGNDDIQAKLKRKDQAEHDRELIGLMLDGNRSPEEDHKLAKIGIHQSRPDLIVAALGHSPQIEQDVQVEKITHAVTHAAEHTHFGIRFSDTDGIQSILESLPPQTVRNIDEASRKLTGKALSDEVREQLNSGLTGSFLGGGQYEMVSRYFERTGASDEAGQIRASMESLERSYMGKVRRMHGPTDRAEMDILKTVSVLTKPDIERVQGELAAGKGQSLTDLTQHPRLSKAAQETLAVLIKSDVKSRSAEDINAIVDIAQKEKRLDILKLALRMAPEDVREQIKNTRQDELVKTFTAGTVFKDYYRKNVVDYLNEGQLSLSTLIAGNTKPIYELSNTKEINRLVENASPQERERYLTDATYRQGVDAALDKASKAWFGYDAAIWKSKLADKESLTTALLPLGTPEILGKRPARADWAKVLDEKFGPREYKLFKENPAELVRFEKDINLVFAKADRLELMGRLKEKLGYKDVGPTDHPTLLQTDAAKLTGSRSDVLTKLKLSDTADVKGFEDGQNKARRTISEMLSDARNPEEKARALYSISTGELEAIKSDKPGARQAMLAAMDKSLPAGSAERHLADLAFKRLTSGDSDNFDAMETVALAAVIPNKPIISVRAIELAMSTHPEILDIASNDPQTKINRQLIDAAFTRALGKSGIYDSYDETGTQTFDIRKEYAELFTTGRMSLSHRLDLVSGMAAKRDILINDLTEADKTILRKLAPNREEVKLQQKALGYGEQRQLSLNVMQQGGTSTADMARAFYLGNKESWLGQKLDGFTSPQAEQLTKALQELPRDAAAKVAAEYLAKYGTVMSQDILSRVAPADRLMMRQALSQFDLPATQLAMMARQERDGSNGARPFDWLTTCLDYSGPGAKESNDALISILAHKQEELAKQDPAAAKEFETAIKSYLQAEENHGDTKRLLWALAAPVQMGGWTGLAYLAGKHLPVAAAVIGSKLMGKAQAVATLAIDRNILGPKQFTVMDGFLDVGALPFASIKATYYQLGKRAVSEMAAKSALSTGTRVALDAGSTAAAVAAASIILSSTP